MNKYTLPINETYFCIMHIYYSNETTTKVKGFFAYKRGILKDRIVEGPRIYKFGTETMKYWELLDENE